MLILNAIFCRENVKFKGNNALRVSGYGAINISKKTIISTEKTNAVLVGLYGIETKQTKINTIVRYFPKLYNLKFSPNCPQF